MWACSLFTSTILCTDSQLFFDIKRENIRCMSPPCQFYNASFMYINLNYIITMLKSFNIKKYSLFQSYNIPLPKIIPKESSTSVSGPFRDMYSNFLIQWRLKFQTFKFRTCLKSECFKDRYWNGSILKWSGLQLQLCIDGSRSIPVLIMFSIRTPTVV